MIPNNIPQNANAHLQTTSATYYAPWFLGCPITKGVTVISIFSFIVAEVFDLHRDLSLDMDRLLHDNEIWRVFTCQLAFSTIGEVLFGLLSMVPLMRRFEREMGSKRFGTYLMFVSMISMSWELLLSQIFHNHMRYSGPYNLIGASLLLFHIYAPRLHPHFFGILGFDFSEKSMTYALVLQTTCSGGISTALPVFCGIVSGFLCSTPVLPIFKWQLPQFIYTFFSIAGAGFVDHPVTTQRRRRVRQNEHFFGADNNPMLQRNRVVVNPTANNPTPPTTANLIQPPSEEAIESLTSMGFERQAVIRTLQQCDNNVELAANRLLSG